MTLGKLQWYWRRLGAMSPSELLLHARRKTVQYLDGLRERDWAAVPLEGGDAFPRLPRADQAPAALRQALRDEADRILHGHWRAFGTLDLRVDDPPKWHCDYLAGRDLPSSAPAYQLNHRHLPGGADIKLIWELSRWYQPARLAMAAYVLEDERAAEKCLLWLADWFKHNPPFRGWNWTSALEGGLRLVQFTWIDALLSGPARRWGFDAELDTLRYEILPAHVWFTWRQQSFGSSANNHLIGELTGLIAATARWPALARWGASLDELQRRWERQVLAQFAEDGGNREQALHYHLFAWEFCWQARTALAAAGRTLLPEVEDRLRRAAQFFVDLQVPEDPWDYGDSDNACVLPVFADEERGVAEWHGWLQVPGRSAAIEYWLGAARPIPDDALDDRSDSVPARAPAMPGLGPDDTGAWCCHERSGYALYRRGGLVLRWDLSPLGYLKTAAHGHLDALHLSVWLGGVALIIDPGTGCYYANDRLRAWLASRPAHNAPAPEGIDHPQRLGPFLWGPHEESLLWSAGDESPGSEELREWFERATGRPMPALPPGPPRQTGGIALRQAGTVLALRRLTIAGPGRFVLEDACWRDGLSPDQSFSVRWQFAPGATLSRLEERRFRVVRKGVSMIIEAGAEWAEVVPVTAGGNPPALADAPADLEREFAGTVSPSFRKIEWAPFLKLVACPQGRPPQPFRTVFLPGE